MKKENIFSGNGCIYNCQYKYRDMKNTVLAFDFFDLLAKPQSKIFIEPNGMTFFIAEITGFV